MTLNDNNFNPNWQPTPPPVYRDGFRGENEPAAWEREPLTKEQEHDE